MSLRKVGWNQISSSPHQHVVVGEDHSAEASEEALHHLIREGEFDCLFLEALNQGSFERRGKTLKDDGGVYGWDPEKYDRMTHLANVRDLEVHGIDDRDSSNLESGYYTDTETWASYIQDQSSNSNIVVTGSQHLPGGIAGDLVNSMVQEGIGEEEILVIDTIDKTDTEYGVNPHSGCDLDSGLYALDGASDSEIPSFVGNFEHLDFLYVHDDDSNREPASKYSEKDIDLTFDGSNFREDIF